MNNKSPVSAIDSHVHLFTGKYRKRNYELLPRAERFGIRKIAVSSLGREEYIRNPTEKEVSESNNDVRKLMKKYPAKVYGLCYLNPLNKNWTEELKKRYEEGFTGIKLWIATKCSSPEVFSVVEKGIGMGMVFLLHSFLKTDGNIEGESSPCDVRILAEKYPEANIIMAHAGGNGGGGIEEIKRFPNVSVDISGGPPESGVVEKAVKLVGERRVLFGSDAPGRSFSVQLARVLSADITVRQKKLILHDNFLRVMGDENL